MELKAYLQPLGKWWWLLLLSACVAAAASGFAVYQQPNIYEARSTLLIGSAINNPNPTGNEFWLSQQLAQTYANLAQRDVVRQAVMERIGLTWLPEYSAASVPNTQLMEIVVRDTSPERAMVVANELAAELIAQAPTSNENSSEREVFISSQLDELELKIKETHAEILERQTELAGLFSARQIADTQSQIAALETKKNTLQSNYASLLASTSQGAANTLSLIEDASLPKTPVGPERLMTIITAAAIGLSLAVGAAYLLEYLDDTLKTPADIQAAVKLPTLAGIAEFRDMEDEQNPLVTMTDPRSPVAEAYRSLRTALMFTNIDRPNRVLLVSSANPGEGKSVTVANLGVVMAQAGHRVLIVDADLRRPTQHQLFGISREVGLTSPFATRSLEDGDDGDAKLGEGTISRMISLTRQPGLFVMTSGMVPPNPAELIGSRKMQNLLQKLEVFFDVILIDSPPILAVTDAVVLSTRVDMTLLVAGAGMTRRNQLTQAVRQLTELQSPVAGVVLNRLTARSGDYYYYYYRRGTYYGESPADAVDIIEADAASARQTTAFSGQV